MLTENKLLLARELVYRLALDLVYFNPDLSLFLENISHNRFDLLL